MRVFDVNDTQFCFNCMCPSTHVDMGQFDPVGRFFCSPGCMVQFQMDTFHPCNRGAMVVPVGGGPMQRCMGSVVVGDFARCPQCDHFHNMRR